MQQIADQVGVHVTTVSRAVDDKWIQTPRGIFPLRGFFVGGITAEDGEDVAWDSIRAKLQEIIDKEDKAKPHSDDELVRRLKAAGFSVARRTVTKYRKKMGIPVQDNVRTGGRLKSRFPVRQILQFGKPQTQVVCPSHLRVLASVINSLLWTATGKLTHLDSWGWLRWLSSRLPFRAENSCLFYLSRKFDSEWHKFCNRRFFLRELT